MVQRMTTSDSTSGAARDNEWQRVTKMAMSDSEGQRVIKRISANESK